MKSKLELLNEDVGVNPKKTGWIFKRVELEKNLPGLTVKIKQQPIFAQKLKIKEDAGDYVMFILWDECGGLSQIQLHILNMFVNRWVTK